MGVFHAIHVEFVMYAGVSILFRLLGLMEMVKFTMVMLLLNSVHGWLLAPSEVGVEYMSYYPSQFSRQFSFDQHLFGVEPPSQIAGVLLFTVLYSWVN